MSPRMWVWCVTWENKCYNSKPSVNVVAPTIQAAMVEGMSWLHMEENSDISPEDCTLIEVVRGVEIG